MNAVPAIPGLPEHLAVLAVIGVGSLLLFFGGKILRPAILLAALVVSGALGLRLAASELDPGLLGLPPAVWAIGIPLIGVALAFMLYRLCLAGLLGTVAAVAGFLLTVTFASLTASSSTPPPLAVPMNLSLPLDAEMLSQLDVVLGTLSERVNHAVATASGWLAAQSGGAQPNVRMLGLAVATVCGVIGLSLGLIMPDRVARIATVVIGSWLLLVAGTSLWEQYGSSGSPLPPSTALIAWCVLAAVGAAVQSRQNRPSTDEKG